METCDEIHVGDIGTVFEITLYDDCEVLLPGVDLAITKTIFFEKKDGTLLTKTAEFTTDGADSKIQYVTVEGDLDQAGGWKVQAKVELPTGIWYSTIDKFKVVANLDQGA